MKKTSSFLEIVYLKYTGTPSAVVDMSHVTDDTIYISNYMNIFCGKKQRHGCRATRVLKAGKWVA